MANRQLSRAYMVLQYTDGEMDKYSLDLFNGSFISVCVEDKPPLVVVAGNLLDVENMLITGFMQFKAFLRGFLLQEDVGVTEDNVEEEVEKALCHVLDAVYESISTEVVLNHEKSKMDNLN